jgi:hypothetical protein
MVHPDHPRLGVVAAVKHASRRLRWYVRRPSMTAMRYLLEARSTTGGMQKEIPIYARTGPATNFLWA